MELNAPKTEIKTYQEVTFWFRGDLLTVCFESIKEHSTLFGFVTLTSPHFGTSGVIINPVEERWRDIMKSVDKLHIPTNTIFSIVEVQETRSFSSESGSVVNFPAGPAANRRHNG